MLNNQSITDTQNLMTGKDGLLFLTAPSGQNIPFYEVDNFQVKINVNNADYHPIGSNLKYAVTTEYSITLTFTEALVRDDFMMSNIIDNLEAGFFPEFQFQGMLRTKSGKEERMTFRHCILDGTLDLMNIIPGEIVKRTYNFRVNNPPELSKVL